MNPSMVRSRKWMIEALLQLMEEKPYEEITISEIAKRSDLSRRTFYRNFTTKEAILEANFDEMIEDYLKQLPDSDEVGPYTLGLIYFRYWKQHLTFIQALQRNGLFHILLRRFDDFVPKLNKRYKKAIIKDFSPVYFEYYTAFIAAGLWHMLERWVAGGLVESPEALAEMYERLIKGM